MKIKIEYYGNKNSKGFNIKLTPSLNDVYQIEEIIEHCNSEMVEHLNRYLSENIENIKISELSDCNWNKNTETGYITYNLPICEEYWCDIKSVKKVIIKAYKLWKSKYLADMRIICHL